MTTPTLFGLAECTPLGETLTLGDVDEMIGRIRNEDGPSASYVPYRWVVDEFERILVREVRYGMFYRTAYLALLAEVRRALADVRTSPTFPVRGRP